MEDKNESVFEAAVAIVGIVSIVAIIVLSSV